ncbi:MAG: methyl-accepting chemotaxis protein [Clostridia bacterium]|nr:methyl-accepting chemotaxis protein [Clostridia bacterium]
MKWYYNMKIGTRLIIAFFIVAAIAGVIGVIGVLNIRTIDDLDTQMYEKMTAPLGELIIIVESYQRMRNNVKDILLSDSEAEIADFENRIKERNQEFEINLASHQKTLLTEEGKKLVRDLFDRKKQYDSIINETLKMAKAGNKAQALSLLKGDGENVRKLMESDYRRLVEIKVEAAKKAAEENTKTANAATAQTIIILTGGMLIAVMLGLFIASSIRNPINKLLAASQKIAAGDLDVNIDIDSKDEIGLLAKAFIQMSDNINEVMSNINSAAEQVASGSKQVSESSMALSQGATEQASSIEELTASLEEISSQTKQNADNANQANSLAEAAKDNAVKGNLQMKEMLKAMDEINDASSSISKIIKVIDEIAFQTNILALNAAVEAARAGQHGKGFAVVAEEVRNLAARSASAAKETTAMIEGSIKKVEGGTKIANETASALNMIVEGVTKVTSIVADIATASNEQAMGIAQINQGIMQVSQVVQTNSATSEESAAASEELASQAELLKEQVMRFKLKRKANASRYSGDEEIKPDMLKMLEGLSNKQTARYESSQALRQAAPAGQKRIVLSDSEFGKY